MASKRTKKLIAAILASLSGVSAMTVASFVVAYDAVFPRYERPDYTLKPGQYCFERLGGSIERRLFSFPSKEEMLQGYYYPARDQKGLILVAHGFHAGADDYLPMIEYFVRHRYAVVTYDVTGTYDSEGETTVGMCQSLVDIDYAIRYLKSDSAFADMPLYLVGHSWGGYAVSSVLALQKDIKACACIAPMNSGYTMMLEKGEQFAGKLARMPKPLFDAYQKIVFGEYIHPNGFSGVNAVDIPVVIAQGIDDRIITFNGQSVMAHRHEITNPNVVYYIGKGVHGDHNNIWHSPDAALYQMEVESELKLLAIEKGGELTDDEKRAFYETVDHRRYSAVNEDLMSLILDTFDKA